MESAAFDRLSDDMGRNILSKLPLKTLVRFMSVSDRWKDAAREIVEERKEKMKGLVLVNFVSIDFPGMYIPRYAYVSQNSGGGAGSDVEGMLDLMEYVPVKHFTVRDVCNGLLLCVGISTTAVDENGDPVANFYVCNPVTRQWAVLPESPPASSRDLVDVLAFDPTVSHYKVLRWYGSEATRQGQQQYVEADVYCSSSGTWSRRRVPLQRRKKNITCPTRTTPSSTFLKGFVFRLADPNAVIAVDVSGDRIPSAHVIDLPFQKNDPPVHRCLAKWPVESLCCVDYNKTRIEMWVLEDFPAKTKWEMKRAVSVERLTAMMPMASVVKKKEKPLLPVTMMFRGRVRGEEEIVVVLEVPDGVACYNLRTSEVEGVYPLDYLRRKNIPFRDVIAYPFYPCLCSP
ncbi:hypothetical protein H6P81_018163 [Aristolochia fimbriata]|uniref:F-box domain-containing protein n=1 Tax=Aristolochia fimbriata TaxID=158543 RepID=A0AAV7E0K5_ARIFI|nr:hypothetical protein H6P81_018163 [Aristolochia fimbriata]